MEIHKKTWPDMFEKILQGKKNAEIRLADFSASSGDILVLEEYNPEGKKYTGRSIKKKIKNINKIEVSKYYSPEQIEKCGFWLMEFE